MKQQEGIGFLCPVCGSNTLVTDTYKRSKDNTTGRRRRCRECGFKFNTIERIRETPEPRSDPASE